MGGGRGVGLGGQVDKVVDLWSQVLVALTWVGTLLCTSRPNNLSLVCLYLPLYISFLLFGHLLLFIFFFLKKKKNVQIIKRKYKNDKYKHTRDRLFGLIHL